MSDLFSFCFLACAFFSGGFLELLFPALILLPVYQGDVNLSSLMCDHAHTSRC